MNAKKMVFVGRWLAVLALAYGGHASGQSSGMVPGCLGCFPRTGPVYDSTHVTPAPPFTTSASTGAVYIPPREVIVQVPVPSAPAPSSNDPADFTSSLFACSASGTAAQGKAQVAALGLYQSQLGRCADSEGLAFWATSLANCMAGPDGFSSWDTVNSAPQSVFNSYAVSGKCRIDGSIGSDKTGDISRANALCVKDATDSKYVTSNYKYVRSTSSRTCVKG